MNQLQPYGPHDEVSSTDGDEYFTGVDERWGPTQVPPGFAARAVNLRFRFGEAATRLGVQICPWMTGDGRTPWTEVYGGAVFSDPNGTAEWFLIAADGGVWRTRPNMVAQRVALPAGVVLTADSFAQFVQCFNVLILLRGAGFAPLVCANLDAGFKAIVQSADGAQAGLSVIPNSAFGLSYLNRLLLVKGKDILAVSDIQDYTSYLALADAFRINQGNVDQLVAVAAFDQSTLIAFKDNSVLQINSASGDFADAQLTNLTDKYGCTAPRSVAKSGKNIYWLAETGVASLTLTQLNQLQDTELQLSDPMLKTFARINWLYAAGAVAAIWNQRLYLALPLDDAKFNGRNLIAHGAQYPTQISGNEPYVQGGFKAGTTYHYVPDTQFDAAMFNGNVRYTTEQDFTAVDAVCYFTYLGIPGAPPRAMNARIQLILTGVNNAVVVYDFLNQAWCGVDEAPGVLCPKQFLRAKYNGARRLFIVGADGILRLYEEGYEDEIFAPGQVAPAVTPISSTLVLRGYRCQDADRKRFLALTLLLKTWNPSYTLTTLVAGVNASQDYQTDVTRNRLAYDIQSQADWDPSNANDDHGTAGRLDYSFSLPDSGFNLGSGVNPDAEQASTERVPVSEHGHFMQVQIVNTTGRLTLTTALMEAQRGERLSGAHVN